MNNLFPQPNSKAVNRFMNMEMPVATVYVFNKEDHKVNVDDSNKRRLGCISVNMVEDGSKERLFTRSIPVFKNPFAALKGDFKKLLKENEKIVLIGQEYVNSSSRVWDTNIRDLGNFLQNDNSEFTM